MRNFTLSIFIFVLVVSCAFFGAAEEEKEEAIQVGPGQERIKINDLNLLVPKGTTLHQHGNLIIVGGNLEYLAKKFAALDKRLFEIEINQDRLIKELELLKANIQQIRFEPKEALKAEEQKQKKLNSEQTIPNEIKKKEVLER